MQKVIFGFLILIVVLNVKGQAPAFPTKPQMHVDLFQPHLIKERGISQIVASYAYKYDMKGLFFTKKEVSYTFDLEGRVIKKVEKNEYKHSKDSVLNLYYYDSDNRINTHFHKDAVSQTVYIYEYGSSSYRASAYLIPKEKTWNENLNDEYLIWSDSIFIKDDRHTFYNRFKLAYKYTVHRDKLSGQNKEISEYMKGGKINRSHHYSYAVNGLLLSIEEMNYNKFQYNWKKEFTYYIEDHLKEEHYYKNGKIEHIRKISYTDDGLPEFDITRNEVTTKMTIIQFKYKRQ